LIIRRYLYSEILYTLSGLTALLVLIYISHRFMVYLVQAAAGNLPTMFIWQLLAMKLLSDLMLILPLGFFLAILLALGRLYKDNEITVMAACGIGVPVKSLMFLGVLMSLFVGGLSLLLAPWAERQMAELKTEAHQVAEVSGVVAGRFKEFNQGQGSFYVESIRSENQHMYGVFAQLNLPDKQIILTAKQASQRLIAGALFMIFQDGYRYERVPGQLNYVVTDFVEHRMRLPDRIQPPAATEQETLSTLTLWQQTDLAAQAELQWRLSLPLTAILLTALAIPLSRTSPRQGQYAKIFAGILLCLVYNNLLNIAKKWVERDMISPLIGLWWVHGLMLLVVILLFYFPSLKIGWQQWQLKKVP